MEADPLEQCQRVLEVRAGLVVRAEQDAYFAEVVAGELRTLIAPLLGTSPEDITAGKMAYDLTQVGHAGQRFGDAEVGGRVVDGGLGPDGLSEAG
jgi:hypothetical protein